MSVVVICDQWTGPGAPSRPARRTRIRRRPAAGAPAAGARVGGQSAARPTAGAAGGHPPDHLKPDQVRWEPPPEPAGPLL